MNTPKQRNDDESHIPIMHSSISKLSTAIMKILLTLLIHDT